MTLRVGVFDYGAGNLHSLLKAIEAFGASTRVYTDCREALSSDALVLPGVGSLATASSALGDAGDEVRAALGRDDNHAAVRELIASTGAVTQFGGGVRDREGIERAFAAGADCARRGAGELLLTSIDRDGSRRGYDLELTRRVASLVSVPVVASSGILHDGVTTVAEIKAALAVRGMSLR